MNDDELHLRDVLHHAVPTAEVPGSIVSTARCRASRLRRRRVATRAALGAVALVATGAVAQQRSTDLDVDRISPLASHSPTHAASPVATSGVRLTVSGECETTHVATRCQRLTLELVRPGEDPQRFVLSERYLPGDPAFPVPPRRVVLTLADGTERSAPPREIGPGEWMYDLDLPPLDEFDTFTLATAEDLMEIRISIA